MLDLNNAVLLGIGNERACYIHPKETVKCIKVNIEKRDPSHIPQQSLVEYDYYQYLNNKNIPFTYLPRCHGWVETSLGRGLVFDRIISTKQGSSITLTEALSQEIFPKEKLHPAINQLYGYLKRHNILLSDISLSNICVKEGDTTMLYLIDGIGSRNHDIKYKIRKQIPLLAKIKTIRQWQKYHHKLFF